MFWRNRQSIFLFILLDLLETIICRQIPDDQDDEDVSTLSTQTTLAICLSTLSVLIVLVVVVIKCMDCYNSEVSTECHPASNSSGVKWGGANYSTNTAGSGTVSFGEIVNPDELTRGLPYSMIPTNIPPQGGFQGYQTADSGDNPSSGALMGYQRTTSTTDTGNSSRHYNPAEQPPPPAYTDALRQSNLYGNS